MTSDPYKASGIYSNVASFKLVYGARTGANGSTAGGRLTALDFFRTDAVVTRASVDGYKSVKLTTDPDGSGSGTAGDTLTYTITYVNTGNAAVSNFQITDLLPTGLTAAAGAQTVRLNGTATPAARNTGYTGAGANTNLLATGQSLPVNGTVSVDIPVTVGTVSAKASLLNQAAATGGGVAINSDNVDSTTIFPPSVAAATGFSVPSGSIAQTQTASVDPTTVNVFPTTDLAINKTGSASVVLGSVASYTLTVWNKGPAAVTGATITDTVPGNLTVVNWNCAASGTATCGGVSSGTGNAINITAGILPVNPAAGVPTSGSFLTITVTGTASTVGSLTNIASVAVPTGSTDPVGGNNSSQQVTNITHPNLTCSTTLYGLFGSFTTPQLTYRTIAPIDTVNGTVGATIATVPSNSNERNYSLSVSADGGKFFVGGADGTLKIYDVASGQWDALTPTIPGFTTSPFRMGITKASGALRAAPDTSAQAPGSGPFSPPRLTRSRPCQI
ncbi:isopeptide-forming domain-containing fimbrial protein [Deinococcus arenicola]|uniref:Isopeptide-forming domain-containing fimbrial protein n=1 Tax=Deinococcus arenicola TaxID=2994950 RepID=A0ABU4DUH8_9DEIO|nr:isopeptide-forming domain-containing fimbrial protein [Deinococcus sp. ZS9-10]MDV6376081.1 isopeptide-forming domain-containing fimbrial protein [Deinococcus sp. ZS9-10]